MAVGQEMAIRCEVMLMKMRVLILSAFAFLLFSPIVSAAPPAPIIKDSNWSTGEIQVCWEGATKGNAIYLYTAKWDDPTNFTLHDIWVNVESNDCRISQWYENGQTIWFYIRQYDGVEFSTASNRYKLTPPITAYIINWPDMFGDMWQMLQAMNDDLKNHLDGLATPSDQAMNDLRNAIDNLKDALGAGSASNVGSQLQSGLSGLQQGMSAPIGVDDGNGTFTGGSTGGQMPFQSGQNSGGGINLDAPNPDSGTSNALTFRIPYGVDMNGDLLYVKILTDEQLEKMKWLNVARNIAGAIIFILFGFWLVSRFSPQLKS